MIRPTVPEDTPRLVAMGRGTGVFKPMEIVALEEVLDDYHETHRELGHIAISYEVEGHLVGFAYYAPAAMTDRTWYLYWIIVEKSTQAKGIGSTLLRAVEDDIRNRDGRLFLIETSSTPHYEPTRRFYLKHGYDRVCTLPGYYAEGDDLVVFGKRFGAEGRAS